VHILIVVMAVWDFVCVCLTDREMQHWYMCHDEAYGVL